MREEVGNSVGGTGDVVQCIIEVLEEFNPSGLLAGNFLWFAEVLEVLVICEHFNRVLCTKKEGASTFKAKDDASEFLVMDIIVVSLQGGGFWSGMQLGVSHHHVLGQSPLQEHS